MTFPDGSSRCKPYFISYFKLQYEKELELEHCWTYMCTLPVLNKASAMTKAMCDED